MTQAQIEAAIPGLSKKDCHTAINKILMVVRSSSWRHAPIH